VKSQTSNWDYARWSVGIGLLIMGVGLLAIGWTDLNNVLALWWTLPLMSACAFAAMLWHDWSQHVRALGARRAQIDACHNAREAKAEQEARALVEQQQAGKFAELDQLEQAIRVSQIVIWQVNTVRREILFDGVHVGASDYLPEKRTYHGNEWYERLHPEDRVSVMDRFAEFLKGRTATFEHEYRVPDERGHWRWIISRGFVVERTDNGHVVLAAGSHTDIHLRKQAQLTLQQERSLFDVGPVAVIRYVLDDSRRIDFASKNIAKLWRYPRNWTLVGKSTGDMVPDEDLAVVRPAIMKALSEGRNGIEIQVRLRMGDGSLQWFLMRGVFEHEDGKVYLRAYLISIADYKALETQAHQHRARLEQLITQLNEAQADSVTLQDSSDLLNTAASYEEAFKVVRQAASRLFPEWHGGLSVICDDGSLALVGQWGEPPPLAETFRLDQCWGLRRGRAHNYMGNGMHLCCEHLHAPLGFKLLPYLCLPMSANGETVGALHLFAPGELSPDVLSDLESRSERFAETLKMALSNLRLRNSLSDRATRDGLTGLYNRRLLDQRLPIEITRCAQQQMPVSLAMIDIDHFKRFNDTWGHEAGDLVLQTVGHLLMEKTRVYDLAFRYGGEELVLVMPGCRLDDALIKLDQIRHDIEALSLSFRAEVIPKVTVSIGVAETTGGSPETLLRRADEALYQAKRLGRNRVHAAEARTNRAPEELKEGSQA
jgi:diguanylate cyclase (GGDEF)-like protein